MMNSKEVISVKEAKSKLDSKKAVLIDVRSPAEFESVHIKGSFNIPLDEINKYKTQLSKLDKEVITICRSGNRSSSACQVISDVVKTRYTIEGGIVSWEDNDFPVIKGKPRWDLERQVRFVAGGLVVIGALLGFFVNYWFFLISGFVGFGLMFAALTNSCMMGMLLSKMWFNNVKHDTDLVVKRLVK